MIFTTTSNVNTLMRPSMLVCTKKSAFISLFSVTYIIGCMNRFVMGKTGSTGWPFGCGGGGGYLFTEWTHVIYLVV